MAPVIYKGRGETAQRTDVGRKKIDAQNSTEAGVMRSIINDYFSVDYLEGVQEYQAQIIRILKESSDYRNYRETSNSLFGQTIEQVAKIFGGGSKRYIVRVPSVDLGIPAPEDFGSSDDNTSNVNDSIINLHAHHEMVPEDDTAYELGDIVVIRFNNNSERTDGVIVRKNGAAPENANGQAGGQTPENGGNYAGAAAGFNDPNNPSGAAPGTVGCTATEAPATTPEPPLPPQNEQRKKLDELIKKSKELEEKIVDLNSKIQALKTKKKLSDSEKTDLAGYKAQLRPAEDELETVKEEYKKYETNLNAIDVEKKEVDTKLEAAKIHLIKTNKNIEEITKKIDALGFAIADNDQEKIERINLNGQKTFEENQYKVTTETIEKLTIRRQLLDNSPSIPPEPQPATPPPPCPPSPPGNATKGNKKYPPPNSQQRLELIRAVVKGCRSMGFNNTNFIAAVCANIQKETGWTIRPEYDYGGTSAERLRKIFGKRLSQFNDQELYQLAFKNEEFYDYIYGYKTKTLGKTFENTQPGDGYKYRGRGFIGYTGKGLYRKASQAIFKNDLLVREPDRANEPEINGKFLAYYLSTTVGRWEKNLGVNRNNLTPEEACALITSAVGGTNIRKAVENEKKAGKDGIWTEIFNKVLKFFPQYLEEAAKK
jgi:predicted chitinase